VEIRVLHFACPRPYLSGVTLTRLFLNNAQFHLWLQCRSDPKARERARLPSELLRTSGLASSWFERRRVGRAHSEATVSGLGTGVPSIRSCGWLARALGPTVGAPELEKRPQSMSAGCVVVGAGPGGLTAAVYLARYLRDVVVLDDGRSRQELDPLFGPLARATSRRCEAWSLTSTSVRAAVGERARASARRLDTACS
jgi:hypothetical protein